VQAIGAAPSLAPVIEHVLPFLADTASGIAVGVASFAAVEGATFFYNSARRLTGAAKERESVSAAVTSKPQPAPRPVIEPVHGPDAPLHLSETMKDAAEAVVPQEPEASDNKRPSPPPCSITL
jgi:hypothetical protein